MSELADSVQDSGEAWFGATVWNGKAAIRLSFSSWVTSDADVDATLLAIEKSARQLANFFEASTELLQVMARACGHDHVSKFNPDDLTTWKRDMADLTGIAYGGVA